MTFDFLSVSKTGKVANRAHRRGNSNPAFIFDWDVEENTGSIVGIINDIPLRDWDRKDIRSVGWNDFFSPEDLPVSGRYRWEGTYFAHQDYWGEWDCGWDLVSLEPADRKTRKAVARYEKESV